MSLRAFEYIFRRLQDIFKASRKDIFKTFSRRPSGLPRSRIFSGGTAEKFMVSVENL